MKTSPDAVDNSKPQWQNCTGFRLPQLLKSVNFWRISSKERGHLFETRCYEGCRAGVLVITKRLLAAWLNWTVAVYWSRLIALRDVNGSVTHHRALQTSSHDCQSRSINYLFTGILAVHGAACRQITATAHYTRQLLKLPVTDVTGSFSSWRV